MLRESPLSEGGVVHQSRGHNCCGSRGPYGPPSKKRNSSDTARLWVFSEAGIAEQRMGERTATRGVGRGRSRGDADGMSGAACELEGVDERTDWGREEDTNERSSWLDR